MTRGRIKLSKNSTHASSADLLNASTDELPVGVRQRYLQSPVEFHLFRYADNIYLMGGTRLVLLTLTFRPYERAGAYRMVVSAEKSKIMENSMNSTNQ
ncbi:hypothetical protein DPMN_174748 [Dreissena polymorpha]|uniref:Uncharacterized protein n=1 Tax=Dreissena polymorpha TaxID=45954 RepID=A0A9D4IHE9_DREPO|nr:hypothetical protein DPMN_174748 [Dreissena polymorpha]